MPTPEDIKDWIEANLPGARAEVSGDGRHFDATVVYAGFAGKSRVQQQQIVYGAPVSYTHLTLPTTPYV